MQPPSKRQLRPTASLPTTAEKYGSQFGIPDHIQTALQNVGPKGRYSIAQGRNFDRTQSFPSIPTSSTLASGRPESKFQTASENADAPQIIHDELLRARELKPYSHTRDPSTVSDDDDEQPTSSAPESRVFRPSEIDRRDRKRRSSPAEPEDLGDITDTDVDVSDSEPTPDLDTSTSTDDFPTVFQSPKISQPELFSRPVRFPVRKTGRTVKGLPGRGKGRVLGKTVSAPVRMGGWGGAGGEGMNIDGQEGEEDGFDISEWAASEKF